ncbi:MAG: uroporphyrinogen decarboxylase family protein [Phycisphaerae bacterium]|nr:uroporphyrinogen decarboxylase family protein [Phycisphaerae bacterium]
MTYRDRLTKTLLCRATDRPPLPMWLGFGPWAQTLGRWRAESGIADLGVQKYFGLDPWFRGVPCSGFGPWPHFPEREISRTADFVISTDYRGITRRNRLDGACMPEWIDHPIKAPADWERYKRERMQPRLDERLTGLDDFVAKLGDNSAGVQVGSFPWGVFGTTRDLLGAEGVLMAFYDQPDMVRDIMDTQTSLWLAIYGRIAARVQIDCIHIWEDMSGRQGSLISPAMIEEFMMPHYDRIATFARRHNVPIVSVDTDGRMDQIVAVMTRHGVNGFMPFEVQAGSIVEDYRKQYPTLGLMGGLDKRALAEGKPEMHRELDRAARLIASGGWVPGFDHLIPPDVPWANFAYFVENMKRIVGL